MKRGRRILLCILLPFVAAVSSFADIPDRPSPQRLVNDFASLFSTSQKASLENMLVAFDDSTSNQIVVVTVKDLDGEDPNWYAAQLGRKWGVGDSYSDNGVVILIKPKQGLSSGQVAIQVGYGLEGAIPDIYCSRIIRDEMIPAFKSGDYYSGVRGAVQTIMDLASGEISEPREEPIDWADLIFTILIIALILWFFFSDMGSSGGRGGRYIYIGPIGGGPWTGGGSLGGGGSFGGGGGFGGFGGGSFGGGGASGSW